MNIDCSNGYLQIVEDGEERQNIKLCKQRWYKNVVKNQTLHFSFKGQSLNTSFTLMNTFWGMLYILTNYIIDPNAVSVCAHKNVLTKMAVRIKQSNWRFQLRLVLNINIWLKINMSLLKYVCGGTYRSEGSISSPFWPQPYVNSMACLYDIMWELNNVELNGPLSF